MSALRKNAGWTGVPGLLAAAGVFLPGHLAAADFDFFEQHIRPVLVERCYKCHSSTSEKVKGDLLLDSREGLLKGGENGPVVAPGDPGHSRLIEAIGYQNPDLQMPPPKQVRLTEGQIADFVAWVKMGAPDPRTGASNQTTSTSSPAYDFVTARKQWAFHPPEESRIPRVRNQHWPKSPIDNFVLARLEEKGIAPAPQANKRTLLRRATFDLIGLPPTPEELDDFLRDGSPEAFARVVDRLLASPCYGERWGRHWLDLVRYTDSFDSRGLGGEGDIPEAYRYRDWVVDAFNDDLPYDQFIVNQIAGDLLPTPEPDGINTNGVIATGVMAIGEWGTGDADKEKMLTDIVADQVDLTGRAFLGLTIACARCHDHKFDPIPTDDYYSLAGIYFSSHILPRPGAKTAGSPVLRIPLASSAELRRRREREASITRQEMEIQATTDQRIAVLANDLLSHLSAYLVAAWELGNSSPPQPRAAFAAQRHLNEAVLGRWIDLLQPTQQALLTKPVRNLLGHPGLHAWRNTAGADTPSVTVNSTDAEIAFLTIKLPPHSISVHPSPKAGVAIAWKCPIAATVRIGGRVIDADPNCGDGIEWVLTQQGTSGRELAKGAIPNGGAQTFADGLKGAELASVRVEIGQEIRLAILPKADYACDTTLIELEICAVEDPKLVWNLSHDVVPNLHLRNPHPDSFGHADVWGFFDLADDKSLVVAQAGTSIARYFDLVRRMSPEADAAAVIEAAAQAQREVTGGESQVKREKPNVAALEALTSPKGPFWSGIRDDALIFSQEESAHLLEMKRGLAMLKENAPSPLPVAHGLQEGGVPESVYAGFHNVQVQIRGRYDRLGHEVPRRFPRLLAGDDAPAVSQGSGRLDLARWIANPSNPLTARVMANRIWLHHFGEGIVRTPNNFGKLGTPPTHPALLDYLASQFIKMHWSIKAMHRAVMLSAAYQQSSVAAPATLMQDPDNLLFSRMNRHRLDAEALRDSLLVATGKLENRLHGPSIRDLNNYRRTLYLMTIRSDRSNYRSLFDAADPAAVVEKRIDTTVAPQALFLLNDPFMLTAVADAAKRLEQQGPADDLGRIGWLYLHLYGRPPTTEEIRFGLGALARARAAAPNIHPAGLSSRSWQQYCQALLCANEFVFVD